MSAFQLLAVAALAAQGPVIMSTDPTAPDDISETLSVDCAGKRLELIRHRPHAQRLSLPELKIDDKPIRIPPVLRDDLLTPRAEYKFGVRCLRDDQGFQVDIWEASRQRGEPAPRYRWGRLILDGNDHFNWSRLQLVDADRYWFS
ncbi:MAG: hypothetical protein ACJ8FN_00520 [Sphingomicrobium sp.]